MATPDLDRTSTLYIGDSFGLDYTYDMTLPDGATHRRTRGYSFTVMDVMDADGKPITGVRVVMKQHQIQMTNQLLDKRGNVLYKDEYKEPFKAKIMRKLGLK